MGLPVLLRVNLTGSLFLDQNVTVGDVTANAVSLVRTIWKCVNSRAILESLPRLSASGLSITSAELIALRAMPCEGSTSLERTDFVSGDHSS